jgi:hypothetical protein
MRHEVPAILATIALVACSDANSIPDATFTNAIDTLVVYAISGTPVFQPSGYAMTQRSAVRLDVSTSADFGYDRTPDGREVLLPGAMLGHAGLSGIDPGLQHAVDQTFDEITFAETNGYKTLDTVTVAVGDVLYLRSRIPQTCFLGVPAYGKVEILSFDADNRTIRFRVLANLNCGYKGLQPGIPTQ